MNEKQRHSAWRLLNPLDTVLAVFGVLWPQLDTAVTFLALRLGLSQEGNPLFRLVFHSPLGLFAGALIHLGLGLFASAFALGAFWSREPTQRLVCRGFLVAWALLGLIVVGQNGVTLWLHWLNSWLY